MRAIGIMQGRLVPPMDGRFQCFPRGRWADEFSLAAQAGLTAIEWIYDLYGVDENPLVTDAGVARMRSLSEQHGVAVRSVCADYFMDKPFLRASASERDERIGRLRWLLFRGQTLGIERIVLPFVDASRIETAQETGQVISLVESLVPAAEETGIELHLETSLPPPEIAALLARLPSPMVKMNYDSGNSASLGYRVQDEFRAYGKRIGSVHIKDRVRGGGTVHLGGGDADLPGLFVELDMVGYQRDLILQVARDQPGDEVDWARQNRMFTESLQSATAHANAMHRGA